VRDLVEAWYVEGASAESDAAELVERLAGWLDPVQRLTVERLFAGWRAMFPPGAAVKVDLEPEAGSVFDHDRRVELRVSPTVGFTNPDGSIERVRLRTGRSATGPDDAAVLHTADPDVIHVDAMVSVGVAEEIPPPDDVSTRIRQLLDLATRNRDTALVPGLWCFGCDSAARCGHYPITAAGGRVYVSTRSITVSKTHLGHLDVCHRRVAWDRVHQLPTDIDGDVELRDGLAAGLRFHELAAAAILADDAPEVVDAASGEISPSEAAELRRMWDNHLRLWETDGRPRARRVEHPAGVTLLVPGVHVDSRGRESTQPVAVTFIGVLDVTGREPDGTPMVVEHRTGRSGEHAPLEAELYAVAAWTSIEASTGRPPDAVAVHLHHLGPEPPECHRQVFDRPRIESALEELRVAASTIAAWHPHDSLSPSWTAGPWCAGCRHRPLCETFR